MSSRPNRSTETDSPQVNLNPSDISKDGGQAAASPLVEQSSLATGLNQPAAAGNHNHVSQHQRGRGSRGRGGRAGGQGRGEHGSGKYRGRGLPPQESSQHADPARSGAYEGSDDGISPQRGGSGPGSGTGRGGTSRAVSANHLLNFQYDSRAAAHGRSSAGRGGGPGSSTGGRRRPPAPRQRYDKDKFLQANFRFLVSDAVDVARFEGDADKMFDWEDVLQVEMLSVTPISCPISLDSPPTCPHITPCGHVFSMSSIMQHLLNHGGDKLTRWAPCPLCFQPLVARELRLVHIRQVTVPSVGDTVTFQLLRRPKTSILPQPVPDTATHDDPEDSSPTKHPAGSSPARSAPWASGALGSSPPNMPGALAAAAAGSTASSSPLLSNPFGKFVTIADAAPLWQAAAGELAEVAVQLTREGGLEAEFEAPSVYAALDVLAVRARRFAERRQELLLAAGRSDMQHGAVLSPAEAGARAEAAVRAVFTASVEDAKVAIEQRQQRAAVEQEFPVLSVGSPPAAARAALASGTGASAAGTRAAAGVADAARGAVGASGAASTAAGSAAATVGAANGDSPRAAAAELHFEHAFSEEEEDVAGAGGNGSGAEGDSHNATPDMAGAAAAGAAKAAGVGEGPGPLGGMDLADGLMGAQQPSDALLGTSPNTSKLNTATANGSFYTYQAQDGQWLFLHPLNLRMLLHHYGAYASCPPKVSARILEVEDVEQSDATRRRWKALAHLPLRGTYRLAECELVLPVLPPESLVPFAEEVRERARRRQKKTDHAARQQRREEAAARAAAAAKAGPTADELRAMPQLGAEGLFGADELAEAAALQASIDELQQQAMACSPPAGGVSFAHMTRMGFAASGPALGTSPQGGPPAAAPAPVPGAWASPSAAGPSPQLASSAPAAAGVWGTRAAATAAGVAPPSASAAASTPAGTGRSGNAVSPAPVAAGAAAGASKWLNLGVPKTPQGGAAAANAGEAAGPSGKKGKKPTLLFSTTQRRY